MKIKLFETSIAIVFIIVVYVWYGFCSKAAEIGKEVISELRDRKPCMLYHKDQKTGEWKIVSYIPCYGSIQFYEKETDTPMSVTVRQAEMQFVGRIME